MPLDGDVHQYVQSSAGRRRLTRRRRWLSLDYETFGEVQLVGPKSVGVWNYSTDMATEAMMVAYHLDEGEYEHVDLTQQEFPTELHDALCDEDVEKWAFNAAFERLITKNTLGIPTPYKGWRCTMALANMQSFTGSLLEVGRAMYLDESKLKSVEGDRLIKMFCGPLRITKKNRYFRRSRRTDPEDWIKFCEYNRQDNIAEDEIREKLLRFEIPDDEWTMYEIDQEINDTGMPVNRKFVENADIMSTIRRAELHRTMIQVTGLDNPNSISKLLPWIQTRGYPFGDLQKASVVKTLKADKANQFLAPECRRALRLRQQASRTSVKKYPAILRRLSPDNMLRHAFQFGGAARTLRWAGRGPQPHNLTKTPKSLEAEDGDWSKLDIAAQIIESGNYSDLALYMAEPMTALAGSVRSSFQAPEGYVLTVCDLKAIESAVVAWLSKCTRMLNVFRDNRDPYLDFGVELYGRPYSEITKAERTICKPAVLGCFGANTMVLTDTGWRRIVEVTSEDKVFDGVEYVSHDGVAYRGRKRVVDMMGVSVTPDHGILQGENRWTLASAVVEDRTTREEVIRYTTDLISHASISDDLRNSLLRCATDARPQKRMSRKASKCVSTLPKRSSDTFLPSPDGTITPSTSIGYETQGTTKKVIYVLPREVKTNGTEKLASISNISGDTCLPWSSTRNTPLATRSLPSFSANSDKVLLRNRLSPARCELEENTKHTYDVLNAGPRQRFMIWTGAGPLIVHNCAYQLGGGTMKGGKRTGLWGYAENMGVEITEEEAAGHVKLFRTIYSEIPDFWYDLDRASKAAIRGTPTWVNGFLLFKMDGPYLTIRLPSGRKMYYYKPKIVTREFEGKDRDGKPITFTRQVVSYMGKSQITHQWGRVFTSGGKQCLTGDTKVLTERGWVLLQEVTSVDRVWDGDNWVSHDGVVCNGVKETLRLDGVGMTPDHQILTVEGWREGRHCDGLDRFAVSLPDGVRGRGNASDGKSPTPVSDDALFRLRRTIRDGEIGVPEISPEVLRMQARRANRESGDHTWDVPAPGISCLAVDDVSMFYNDASGLGELRRSRDTGLQRVVDVQRFLGGHGRYVPTWTEFREGRQQCRIRLEQLRLGDCNGSGQQQKEKVYDIINAGPQHRFTILGDTGPIMSHNCENVVQAVARDILARGMRRAYDYGFRLIGSVHDELMTLTRIGDNYFTLEALRECMIAAIEWATGLPLGASGYQAILYRKD